MIPNDVLHEKMKVDPIPEGTTVEFQLITQEKPNDRGIKRLKPGASLIGEVDVFDPYQQKTVTIGNVTSSRNVTNDEGKVRLVQRTSRVEFVNASIILGSREYNTYQYLMRRDDNESNIFANPSVKKRFKLVSSIALSQEVLEKDMLFDMIKTSIRQADADQTEKVFYKLYPKVRINTTPEQKRHIIAHLGRELADYLKVVKAMPEDFPSKSEIDVVAVVFEAIEKNIITHDSQNRLWRWKDGMRYPGIIEYPPGDDATMKLIRFFKNNVNRKLYNALQDVLAGKKTLDSLVMDLTSNEK